MTYPMPDPGPVIGDPRRVYSVPLKSCCGVLEGDECSCLAFLLEALTAVSVGPLVAYDREHETWQVTR